MRDGEMPPGRLGRRQILLFTKPSAVIALSADYPPELGLRNKRLRGNRGIGVARD